MGIRGVIGFLLAGLALLSGNGCATSAQAWDSIRLENGLIELQIVPEIGGRVLQYTLGDYGFFWVNGDLLNVKPPESGVGPEGEWLNYGGDKLWPAPQGWDSEEQWPGPPDPVLDGAPYGAEVLSESGRPVAVRLTSREDPRSGLQFSRVIKVFEGTTRVRIDATMKNIDRKPRRWGLWAITQLDVGNRHGQGYNRNYQACCPLNPRSLYPEGYRVLYGLVNNPSFQPDHEAGMLRVNYRRLVGKVGLDSAAGWVASMDATDGYVFVHRFTFEPEKTVSRRRLRGVLDERPGGYLCLGQDQRDARRSRGESLCPGKRDPQPLRRPRARGALYLSLRLVCGEGSPGFPGDRMQ